MAVYLWLVIGMFLLTIVGGSVFAVMNCVQSDIEDKNSSAPAADSSKEPEKESAESAEPIVV